LIISATNITTERKKSKKGWFGRKKEDKPAPMVKPVEHGNPPEEVPADESVTEVVLYNGLGPHFLTSIRSQSDVQQILMDEKLRTVAFFMHSGADPIHKSQR